MGWSVWVHFFAVEMRSVYLFYTAVKTFTTKMAVAAEMARETGGDAGRWVGNLCVKDIDVDFRLHCVERGVQEALWRFYISPGDLSGCYREGQEGISFIGTIHLVALIVCAAIIVTFFVMLLLSDCPDWRSGKYLAFTFNLEHTTPYRVVSMGLMGYTTMVFGFFAYEATMGDLFFDMQTMVTAGWSDLMAMGGGAMAMMTSHDPPFDYMDSHITSETFNRGGITNMASQSNYSFGLQLNNAILKARCGDSSDLENLVGHKVETPFALDDVRHPKHELAVALRAVDPQYEDIPEVKEIKAPSSGSCCFGGSPRSALLVS
eukprot:CAMPEP_0206450256 /NCGR_PEP_ID=MMETSP0324_2-20121206/18609_1 /ASSEMBLY_ACC=CAM_ASM_000836 /TAXON_ID=2866 /ORGANISM="Crypthecodinium cohnii, Strain Seligo" /LENGTH=318 /DNA_ID=CAMNT_0053919855 /DNA_START=95 /DNA_END=1051 /DNA_ORIENTATION=-